MSSLDDVTILAEMVRCVNAGLLVMGQKKDRVIDPVETTKGGYGGDVIRR